jgi:hypothetical protein
LETRRGQVPKNQIKNSRHIKNLKRFKKPWQSCIILQQGRKTMDLAKALHFTLTQHQIFEVIVIITIYSILLEIIKGIGNAIYKFYKNEKTK